MNIANKTLLITGANRGLGFFLGETRGPVFPRYGLRFTQSCPAAASRGEREAVYV